MKQDSKWYGIEASLDIWETGAEELIDYKKVNSKINKAGLFVDIACCEFTRDEDKWNKELTKFLYSNIYYITKEDDKLLELKLFRVPKDFKLQIGEYVPALIKECWNEASNEVMYQYK